MPHAQLCLCLPASRLGLTLPVPCRNATAFEYLEEIPVQMLAQLESLTGRQARHGLFVVTMEYGRNFSGPEKDVFFYDRSVGHTEDAWQSNFLHPVVYYYRHLPTGKPACPGCGESWFQPTAASRCCPAWCRGRPQDCRVVTSPQGADLSGWLGTGGWNTDADRNGAADLKITQDHDFVFRSLSCTVGLTAGLSGSA